MAPLVESPEQRKWLASCLAIWVASSSASRMTTVVRKQRASKLVILLVELDSSVLRLSGSCRWCCLWATVATEKPGTSRSSQQALFEATQSKRAGEKQPYDAASIGQLILHSWAVKDSQASTSESDWEPLQAVAGRGRQSLPGANDSCFLGMVSV